MTDLFIYKSDEQPFLKDDVQSKLESIGVAKLRHRSHDNPSTFVEGHFSFDKDTTMIILSGDLQTYSTSDDGPAALEFAVRLQSCHDDPLMIFDVNYTYHLSLKEYKTAQDLDRAIRNSVSQDAA